MLVDDKLAKEKLARILDRFISPDDRPPFRASPEYSHFQKAIELIRNTDLTDCQPRMSAIPDSDDDLIFGHHEKRVIAPAPDQGSVRNATDELNKLAGAVRFFLDGAQSTKNYAGAYYISDAAIEDLIRALPVDTQKD